MPVKRQVSRVRVAESPTKELRGGRGITRLLINPSTTGIDRLDLHLNELRPDSGPGPSHFHETADNIYWVLEGWIEVKLTDESIVLEKDELLHIPPGVVHATSNPGQETARFIEIYAPAGNDFHIVDEVMYG